MIDCMSEYLFCHIYYKFSVNPYLAANWFCWPNRLASSFHVEPSFSGAVPSSGRELMDRQSRPKTKCKIFPRWHYSNAKLPRQKCSIDCDQLNIVHSPLVCS